MLDYRPRGMSMWDTWLIEHGGVVHLFYLQRLAPGSDRTEYEADCLGHATSTDLIHWTEQPLALTPGIPGSLDDLQPWTGSTCESNGKFYLFYTMRASIDNGHEQRTGLALSDDLTNWARWPGNPVITPDPAYYMNHDRPLPKGIVDCRDIMVRRTVGKSGWTGLYAARVPAGELPEMGVIAAVRSEDLVHWSSLPPAFAPRKYACIEVPDFFYQEGRWYLTCHTGNEYGNRGIFSDPHVTRGTIYAVAERSEGPYYELEDDNVLIGSDFSTGTSCRSVEFEGERYIFYTEPSPDGRDTFSPPMLVRTTGRGHLRLEYSSRTRGWRSRTLVNTEDTLGLSKLTYSQPHWHVPTGSWVAEEGVYIGESRTGWQVVDAGIGAANVEIEARVQLNSGVAVGLVYRPDGTLNWSSNDIVFALDAQARVAFATRLNRFAEPRRRRFAVQYGQTYHMRICVRRPRFEMFIDDELVLQFALDHADLQSPSVGLFVDRGGARVSELGVYELGSDA